VEPLPGSERDSEAASLQLVDSLHHDSSVGAPTRETATDAAGTSMGSV